MASINSSTPFGANDASRTATGLHAGLGLFISQAMAAQCNAVLSAKLVHKDTLEMKLQFSQL